MRLDDIRRAPLSAKFGLVVVLCYLVVAIFAPLLAPYGETEIVAEEYAPWTAEFLLGTDNLGRDMLSRLLYGARNSIGIAVMANVLGFSVGIATGFFAAIRGGWIDASLSRTVDVLMAIPALIFALMALAIFGVSLPVMVLVIAVVEATRVFRVARAVAMDIVVMDFVEVAKLRGERLPWVAGREILPNAAGPLMAEFGLRFCFVFLFISSLSFLGLGLQPPTADWGSMVRENAVLVTFGQSTPLIPAVAIGLLAVAVNFVVDWLLHRSSGLKE